METWTNNCDRGIPPQGYALLQTYEVEYDIFVSHKTAHDRELSWLPQKTSAEDSTQMKSNTTTLSVLQNNCT